MRRLVIAAIFAGIVVLLAVRLLSAWPPLIF
jgi:hypothetical protein